ncbi:hypothetical protein CNMCM6936_003391 [Aspergillus lentulus]|uniref:DUF2278 family protein n=1 Tax=Aspergillus lentulus TaxID=293939 RepID=A0AAN5YXE2_ASPLE|nr:hypothetical protein CNMCM6069_003456 [Aspergillus lentulus]KAF4170203.1 hypothetical protein CNMCM6936_003391 [Aspergillus lentulus]KAF4183423.1 hypothetical protein CNMCM8060_003335 [Aspergillus lentulus]KAF4197556.1 hypothetical protein CNMCM8694_002458 [Aspergillus lentulus]KAF4209791.1 hypothetical protein CNMCM8927_004994 [Aspergillus lentulus]
MPLDNYGVWKALAIRYDVERRGTRTPHLTLYFRDNGGPDFRAAINIKSGDQQESRLVYRINEDMSGHPLNGAAYGLITSGAIWGNPFDVNTGRVLEHDISCPNNDIIDVLVPKVQQAINEGAVVCIFGEQFNTNDGIHNVHMNQGNIRRYSSDDGVFLDGALLFHFPESDKWVGIFLAFASQAVHTRENDGHALSRVIWKDLLPGDLVENSVAIHKAVVGSFGQGEDKKQSVTLANLTNRKISLARWRIRNSHWEQEVLPRNAALGAKATEAFGLPNCPLSTDGDTSRFSIATGSRSLEYMNQLLQHAFEKWPGRYHYALLPWPGGLADDQEPSGQEIEQRSGQYLAMGIRPVWLRDFGEIPHIISQLE